MWTDRLRIKRGLTLMWLALAAYAAYVVNAGQFLWKLRMARLQAAEMPLADEVAA